MKKVKKFQLILWKILLKSGYIYEGGNIQK